MPNIKFNYLYRDAGNYKNFGNIIFNNPQNIKLSAIEVLINSKLISHHWFYTNQWQIPNLHFSTWDHGLDHTFHEFESVEYTNDTADPGADIASFINMLKSLPSPTL